MDENDVYLCFTLLEKCYKGETKNILKSLKFNAPCGVNEINVLANKYFNITELNNNQGKKFIQEVENTIVKVFYKYAERPKVDFYLVEFKRFCLISKKQIRQCLIFDRNTKEGIIEIIDYRLDLLVKSFCKEVNNK